MAKDVHTFTGEEVIATEVPQYLNQNFGAIPNNLGVWEANEAVSVGDTRILNGRENAGYILECIEAGTTGNSQPTFSSSDLNNATDLENFSGTLQIAHGGTGATSVAEARNALGLGNTTGALPIANGGTGATSAFGTRNNLNLRTLSYLSFAEIGLGDTTVTITDLVNKLNTIGLLENTTSINFIYNLATDITNGLGLPSGYAGTFFARKSNDRVQLTFCADTGDIWIAKAGEGGGVSTFTGWKKLATQGALSMPSNNAISIGTVLSDLVSGWQDLYTAPADGWVVFEAESNVAIKVLLNANSTGYAFAGSYVNGWTNIYIPVKKGDIVKLYIENVSFITMIQNSVFVYAQSEV